MRTMLLDPPTIHLMNIPPSPPKKRTSTLNGCCVHFLPSNIYFPFHAFRGCHDFTKCFCNFLMKIWWLCTCVVWKSVYRMTLIMAKTGIFQVNPRNLCVCVWFVWGFLFFFVGLGISVRATLGVGLISCSSKILKSLMWHGPFSIFNKTCLM